MSDRYRYRDDILEVYIRNQWYKVDIKEYRVIDIIGEGANGVVLKAEHKITQRIETVKIWLMHKKSKDKSVCEQQYLKEIRKVANLRNGNIVEIYNAMIIENKVYMAVIEYIEGKSLKGWSTKENRIERRIGVCEKILLTVLDYQKEENHIL